VRYGATCLLCLWPLMVFAAADDLEEAAPLAAPNVAPPTPMVDLPYRYRGYVLGEWSTLYPESRLLKNRDQSLVEANGSGSWSFPDGWQLFGDATGTYRLRPEAGNVILNQGGVRYRAEPLELMFGKERARKSPGMVLSPSDFLFRNDALPGMREQRIGVWMARASWLIPAQSADVIYVHNLATNDQGMPADDTTQRGVALRYFYQSTAFDVAANYASIEGDHSVGGWAQTYVWKTTKIYVDAAYRESDRILNQTVYDATKVLVGASYEGYSHGTFRFEIYDNNRGLDGPVLFLPPPGGMTALDALDNIFYRRWYGLASVQLTDLWHDSSFTLNHIRALDYPEWVWMMRYEVPLTNHQLVGVTLARYNGMASVPDATQAMLDWKYSY
jgi:hypothetical protein